MMTISLRFVLLLLTLISVGCGGKTIVDPVTEYEDLQPVTGQISFNGEPIPDATIKLYPVVSAPAPIGTAPKQPIGPSAVVKPDGSFEVFTFREQGKGRGAPIGEYEVSVSWVGPLQGLSETSIEELKELLPVKYTKPKTSGLKVSIQPGENAIPPIALN